LLDKKKSRLKKILGFSLAVVLLTWVSLLAVALYVTHKVRWDAADCLADTLNFRPGESTLQDVKLLVNKYHGTLRKMNPSSVSIDGSLWGNGSYWADMEFDNRWLHRVILAPKTALGIDICVRNNRVTLLSVDISKIDPPFTGIWIEEHPKGGDNPSYVSTNSGMGRIIHLTAEAGDEKRAAAYALNLACLTRIRGCRSVQELSNEP
jgi:hypothetical protein